MLVLMLDILGFVGECTAPLVRQLGGEMPAGLFSLISSFLQAVHYKREL
jgi:hypothetical protein